MKIEERAKELGIVIPAFKPMKSKNLVRARQSGNFLYLGGVGPWDGTGYPYLGKLGRDLDADQGYAAGRVAGIHMLSILKHFVGDLDNVRQFLRGIGYVQCVPGFTDLSRVTNGASDLLIDVFGKEIGTHSRASFGVSELAHNIPFEMIMDVEVS